MKRISLFVGVILIISLSSCCETKYIVKPLPLPDPIETPTEADLSCLSDEVYFKVVKQDKRNTTLRAIILSTHKKK